MSFRMRFFSIHLKCLATIMALASSLTYADDVTLKIQSVTSKGETKELNWKSSAQFGWSLQNAPVLKIEVTLPDDPGSSYNQSSSTTSQTRIDGKILSLETQQLINRITLSGGDTEIGILITISISETTHLIHPSCTDRYINLKSDLVSGKQKSKDQNPLVVGLFCSEGENGQIQATLWTVSPETWEPETGRQHPKVDLKVSQEKLSLSFPTDLSFPNEPLTLARAKLKSNKGVNYTIQRSPLLTAKKRFRFLGGLGSELFAYREEPLSVSATQISASLELKGIYTPPINFLNDRLEASLYFHSLVQSLSITPSTTQTARTYSFWADASYELPFLLFKTLSFRPGLGWSYWGMTVQDDAYGLKYLTGPQAFLKLRMLIANSHPLEFDFRYSAFGGSTFNQNYQFDIAAIYSISAIWKPKQWFATLQGSFKSVSGSSSQFTNSVYATALYAGILYTFF